MKERFSIINTAHFRTQLLFATAALFLCSFMPWGTVHAQTPAPSPSPSAETAPPLFLITLEPTVPRPLQAITASIANETFSRSGLSIQWYMDGRLMGTGSTTTFTFTAPQEERRFEIKAIVTLPDERTATQTIETSTYDPDTVNSLKKNLDDQLKTLEDLYGPINGPLGGTDSGGAKLPFSIVSDNDNPGPFETVNLRISSTIFDPDQVLIRWFQDGKKSDEGVGKTNFTLQTGSIGTKTAVRAQVVVNGKTFEAARVIIPFSVSLYWWADTAVPHWYKGKALPTQNNPVHISAFAPTGLSEQKTFLFFWTHNNEPQQAVSGTGKQSFTFRPRISHLPDSVSVRVQNKNKTLSFETATVVKNVDPEVRFCVVTITSGCSKGTRTATVQAGDSIDVRAHPFYFGKSEVQFLTYAWNINGQEPNVKATTEPWLLTIKPPSTIHGFLQAMVSIESIVSNLTASQALPIEIK